MNEFEVTCIIKPDRLSKHEHITHIGNNTARWMLTRESVIQRIESGREAFYTVDRFSGRRAYVAVVREAGKTPYLRTHADGRWNGNLLALPMCQDCRPV
jgi:hypothetical protein